MIKQTLRILLNKKITRFIHLIPKHQWDLVLKMVFRHNLWCFPSLIMFMDGLYLENDFQTSLLGFHCFHCWYYCFVVVVVAGFVILLFLLLLFDFFIIFVPILCGFVRYYFLTLLGTPTIYIHGLWRPFYVISNILNFSITFFISLSWILFSYLLTVSLLIFPDSIIILL